MTFEEWYEDYSPAHKGDKERATDAWRAALHYAAQECAALENCEENTDEYRHGAGWCRERIQSLSNAIVSVPHWSGGLEGMDNGATCTMCGGYTSNKDGTPDGGCLRCGDDDLAQRREPSSVHLEIFVMPRKYDHIKSEDVPDFIRANFGKIIGVLSCSNPHWWIHFCDDYIAYEYMCCDYADCDSQDYERYTDPELLIMEHHSVLTDNDYWWWA
jgi:hypothetical protein